jgi:uncharacterized protein YdaU (DUF1376 family)
MAESDHITTPGKSPSFQFYANDFTSGTVDLSTEDVGAYIRLLCYQWEKGRIPPDVSTLARITGLTAIRVKSAWARLRRHFSEGEDGAFVNAKLERVRQGQIAFRRRQADNGRRGGRPKATTNPQGTQAFTKQEPTANPNESSSIFSLQSSPKKIFAGDPATKKVAEDLMEFYPEVFAQCRAGAVYRTTQVTFDRDWPNYYALAESYPNVRKLRAMLEVFLTRDMGDKGRPGTPGQFRHMAPECDELLRRSGWKATA